MENHYLWQSMPHPGETLLEKLEEMKMGPKEFALRAGKPEKTIIAVLKGDSSITADMAVQFENITRIPAQFWMDHQRGYDEFIARKKREAVIRQATPWAKQFPLEDMIQKGWLPQVKTLKEKTMEMLSFFGFSNHKAWEEYYFKQQLKVAFRISLAQTKDPYAVSAWLRQGEIQAMELTAKKYFEKKFKETLPMLKSTLENHNDKSFNQLQSICLEVGVKVVKTPSLNNAPISGATRWLSDTPLIQLTDNANQIDHLGFTFFHEVGHILLHGKKDVFLENLEYSDKDNQKENEADEFARKWM